MILQIFVSWEFDNYPCYLFLCYYCICRDNRKNDTHYHFLLNCCCSSPLPFGTIMSFPLAVQIMICSAIVFFCMAKKHSSAVCRFLAGWLATFVPVLRLAKRYRFEYSALERSLFPVSFGRHLVSCRAKYYCCKESSRNRMRFLKWPDSPLACLLTTFPEISHRPLNLYNIFFNRGRRIGSVRVWDKFINISIWDCVISFDIFRFLMSVGPIKTDKQRQISIATQTW